MCNGFTSAFFVMECATRFGDLAPLDEELTTIPLTIIWSN